MTEAQLYRRLSAVYGSIILLDDNQMPDPRVVCQLVHALFNQRARSTTTSGEEKINAVPLLVSNQPALGIDNPATLQRLITIPFPSLVGKECVPELLDFKATVSRFVLPGLLRISHEASPEVPAKFSYHMADMSKRHDQTRLVSRRDAWTRSSRSNLLLLLLALSFAAGRCS